MPFILPAQTAHHQPTFYLVRGICPKIGVSTCVKKLAETLVKQNQKVLIFDALLGLKNYPISINNAKKTNAVLKGLAPLSDLIISTDKTDVIAGTAETNLNALDIKQQQRLKSDLMTLGQNYQAVILDCPSQITSPVFQDFDNTLWVIPPKKDTLLKTLRQASTQDPPQFITTEWTNAQQRNELHLYIKSLLPKSQIIELFK